MSSPYRGSEASAEEPTYCFHCGGRIAMRTCNRCALPASPGAAIPGSLDCPRCKLALAAEALGSVSIAGCPKCHGCFVSRASWDDLLTVVHSSGAPDTRVLAPPPPGAGPSAEVLFRVAACPACRRPMERVTFAALSQTVIDVCAPHGIWFDAVELVAVLGILGRRLQGIEVEAPMAAPPGDKEKLLAEMHEITERVITRVEAAAAAQRNDDFDPNW